MRNMLLIFALAAVNLLAQAEAATLTWAGRTTGGSVKNSVDSSSSTEALTGSVDFNGVGDKNFTHSWTFNLSDKARVNNSFLEYYDWMTKVSSVKLDGVALKDSVFGSGKRAIRDWTLDNALLEAGNHTLSIVFDEVVSAQAQYDIKVDISNVPVPGAVWLFGSALAGMIGLRRRNNV